MTRTRPRVSIGLPVFNGERFLEETLRSLLAQTYTDFELVISDNASTDRTPKICLEYASRDLRIRYYQNERNLGAAENYNRVFQLSRGEYFKWAAADDLCDSGMLERCMEVLDSQPDVVLCYAKTKIIDASGNVIEDYNDGLNLLSDSAQQRFIQLLGLLGECNAVFGLIRSAGLKKTRLIGHYIGSDRNLLAELSLYGRFVELPVFMFYRRHHPTASSSDKANVAQLEFFDPRLSKQIVLPWLRRAYEHFVSIVRSPLQVREKLSLFTYLGRCMVWERKVYVSELRDAVRQFLAKYQQKVSPGSRRGEAA